MGDQRNNGPSVMTGAHNFHIDQQNNNITQLFGAERDGPSSSNRILDASHLRDRKRFPPNSNCLPGTRKVVIDYILQWSDARSYFTEDETRILWLHGFIGSGKSAIAQAVSEKLAQQGRLGASFFFFRGAGDRSKTQKFAATVACQLADAIPSTAPHIEAAFKKHPGIQNYPLGSQFECLVYQPLTAATKWSLSAWAMVSRPVVIVVDGFDHCEDQEEAGAWITHAVNFFKAHPSLPLRFVISGCLEEHIRPLLDTKKTNLLDLDAHPAAADIAMAVEDTLQQVLRTNRAFRVHGRYEYREFRDKLVAFAGQSFLAMETFLKHVIEPKEEGQNPAIRLANLREDEVYESVLASAEHLPHFTNVISTLAILDEGADESLTMHSLAELLQVPYPDLLHLLGMLASVILVPGRDGDGWRKTPSASVKIHHNSFREYLNTEHRSGRFYVPYAFHEDFLRRCVRFVLSPSCYNSTVKGEISTYIRWNTVTHFRKMPRNRTDNPSGTWQEHADFLSSLFQGGNSSDFDRPAAMLALTLENHFSVTPLRPDARKWYSSVFRGMHDLVSNIEHSMPHSNVVAGVFISFFEETKDETDCRDLTRYLQKIRPTFVLPVYESMLVKEGWGYLISQSAVRDDGSMLKIAESSDEHLYRYMVFFWPTHLASALSKDVMFDFDLERKNKREKPDEPVTRWTHTMLCSWMVDISKASRDRMMPGIRRARKEINERYPGALDVGKTQGSRWEWRNIKEDIWYLVIESEGSTIGALDILVGLEQWISCVEGVCDHGGDCSARCTEGRKR